MATKPTSEELMERLAIVQQAIGDRGWSLQVKRELMEELGVCARTVQNYRERIISGMRVELDERSREDRQAEFLERLQGHQRAALVAGKMGPLAAMMNLESRLVGLDAVANHDLGGSVQVVLNVPEVKGKEDK
jgi:hypothetical protein|tara:strand:+ start:208 stop:606 length:399 start_codon:yes stop_codon:yes gene_type:complete